MCVWVCVRVYVRTENSRRLKLCFYFTTTKHHLVINFNISAKVLVNYWESFYQTYGSILLFNSIFKYHQYFFCLNVCVCVFLWFSFPSSNKALTNTAISKVVALSLKVAICYVLVLQNVAGKTFYAECVIACFTKAHGAWLNKKLWCCFCGQGERRQRL